MSFQSLNPELTAKVLWLANLQRNLMQNQNTINEKIVEGNTPTTTIGQQQQMIHPLLIPSLNVSSQKISAMLAALTTTDRIQSTGLANSNNHSMIPPIANSSVNIRSNGSSFGWGNRERKMEENWRMQNRHI